MLIDEKFTVKAPLQKVWDFLLDPEKSLEDAINAAATESAEDIPGILEYSIGQAIQSLNQPGIDAWFNPTDKEKQLWNKLVSIVDKIRSIIH